MTGPELNPCPFCGVRPHVHDDASHSTAFFVDCYNDNCTVQPSAYGLSKAETIAAWNTRAPVTVQDAARLVADAINSDMQTFNRALTSIMTTPEMPVQHFFAEAILAYADALRAIAEGQR